ncbi:MAG: hypothetical protein DHS20C01_20380 [marine bacterium B5-7]|nr:MAG: hypothetical protein DHS20C01_20380 [marine bacterium B5-7]
MVLSKILHFTVNAIDSGHNVCGKGRTRRSWLSLLLIIALSTVAFGSHAQELSDLRWLDTKSAIFEIHTSAEAPYTTEVLDNGYRLRLSFPGAKLNRNIRDISEAGIVRGVFPYETDSPNRANFDILLTSTGHLDIQRIADGYRVSIVEGVADLAQTAAAKAAEQSAAVSTSADPGPYAGLTELERQVLEEIQSTTSEVAAASAVATASSSADSDTTEAVSQAAQSATTSNASTNSSDRARVVLPAAGTAKASQTAANTSSTPAPTTVSTTAASVDVATDADTVVVSTAKDSAADVMPPPLVNNNAASGNVDVVNMDDVVSEEVELAVSQSNEVAYSNAQTNSAQINEPTGQSGSSNSAPVVTVSAAAEQTSMPSETTDMPAEQTSMPAEATNPQMTVSTAGSLQDITYSQLPGGRLQVNFNVSNMAEEPGIFRTNQPPRIVLDFFATDTDLADSMQRVDFGALESIVTAESDDRTRVILNLVAPVDFEKRVDGNGLVLVMESPTSVQVSSAVRNRDDRPMFEKPSDELEFAVSDVDFRRTPEGGGKITVMLTSPEIGVDVRDEAGEILIDFPGASLPPELEKRLDVTDFATPVQTVDTFFTGAGARMIISPVGEYSYSSYQVGETLTVQINPILESDQEREPDEFGYVGERLSFNFQRISVRAALQVIADFTGLNFVTSDSVSGDLSLRLQDVPWDQALDTILQVKGLAKRQKGNVIWVAPAEEIASKERQALEAQNQVSELEPLVSELIQINYARAEDISAILKSIRAIDTGFETSLFGSVNISEVQTESNTLLSSRGNVTVDPRTNTLLVQDTRSKIREVRKLIAQLDRPVRQVLIETRIVEANDDFSRNIGARLGFTRVTENAGFPGFNDSNIGTVIGSSSIETNDIVRNDGIGDRDGVSVSLPSDGIGGQDAASYAFTIAKAGAGFAHLIDLEISALEAEGTGKVIANPRLLTTDQNEAHIEQGQERVFTTSVLGEGSVVTKKAVLGLTVTPQITPDDRLVLDVFVTKDSFVAANDSTINTKQVRTKVLLDNGETVVIGGIYEQAQSESTSKVPLLGDIPLLGALFRKKNKFDNRTELLIFLTPRILDPALTVN